MTPEEYLKTLGIELKSTVLISFIDGVPRNVDLCEIMKRYVEERVKHCPVCCE